VRELGNHCEEVKTQSTDKKKRSMRIRTWHDKTVRRTREVMDRWAGKKKKLMKFPVRAKRVSTCTFFKVILEQEFFSFFLKTFFRVYLLEIIR